MEIYLLGNPRIYRAGKLITSLLSAKGQALVYYLAVTNRPQAREILIALLWPHSPPGQASKNLRNTLSDLRKVVGPHLTITRLTVAINQENPIWLDVAHFQQQLTEAEQEAVDLARLGQAVALYQGEFLEGFHLRQALPFEEWLVVQRELLHDLMLNALWMLAARYEAAGNYKLGLHYATRLLSLEPWREEGHQLKMILLARSGQQSAALMQYVACQRTLAENLGVAPSAQTKAIYDRIRLRDLDGLDRSPVEGRQKSPMAQPPPAEESRQDWGEMPDIETFYGRTAELATLNDWVVDGACRLVAILGLGGQGKTTLAAQLTKSLAGDFDRIIWRSLLNAPPLEVVLRVWLNFLSALQLDQLPDHLDEQLALLHDLLSRHRCLLVLDNFDSLLAPAGSGEPLEQSYRSGYEGYGQLLQRIGQSRHQSCLLLTSRERPRRFRRLEGDSSLVQSLQLSGLATTPATEMLITSGLNGPEQTLDALIARYSGNPLALKLVAQTIRELYGGDVAAFLKDDALVFGEMRHVLDQQFARLSDLERQIMIWLSVEREPVAVDSLWSALAGTPSRRAFLEALRSLQRRSLLETVNIPQADGQATVRATLQNVILEYTTDFLVASLCRELEQGQFALLRTHALLNPQAYEYVGESQRRMLVQPVLDQLIRRFRRGDAEKLLWRRLTQLRAAGEDSTGYAGGNLMNLLAHLGADMRGADFSGLAVWQADLRQVKLPAVNFSEVNFRNTIFRDTFDIADQVAISPDGQLLAAGSEQGMIRIWHLPDGEPQAIFQGHASRATAVAFSPRPPNGRQLLASGSSDTTINLWEVDRQRPASTGEQLYRTLKGHRAGIHCLAFSPDGGQLASSGYDRRVILWDVASGRQRATFSSGDTNLIRSLSFSPDGRILACGGSAHTVELWEVANRQLAQTLRGHTDQVTVVTFSPDGHALASGSDDGTICLWPPEGGALYRTFQGHRGECLSLSFSPDGRLLASAGADQMIFLWNVETGLRYRALSGHTAPIWSMAFMPDGRQLISSSRDYTIRLWDVEVGSRLRTWQGQAEWIFSVAFNPSGRLLASGGTGTEIQLWEVGEDGPAGTLPGHSSQTAALAFSPDGRLLASGGGDKLVRLWDVRQRRQFESIGDNPGGIKSIAFSPDGQTLAIASHSPQLRLWDVPHGRELSRLSGHEHTVWSVAFSPDGQQLASASHDQTARLWDRQGQLRVVLPHETFVLSLAFSPDSRFLVSGGSDQVVRLWDSQTGQLQQVFQGHRGPVHATAFSPDGQYLASAGIDWEIFAWDIAQGRLIRKLTGHRGAVFGLSFNPRRPYLASGSLDGAIKLWDTRTWACEKTLRPEGPYAGMNIKGARGLSEAQKGSLKRLGAIET